jgi:multidrug efflux system membrane fusion protein
MRYRLPSIIIGAAIVIALATYIYKSPQQQQQAGGRWRGGAGEGPVPVLVAAATLADVPVYFDGVGTTRALNTVTVRPQVDGKLISVNFKEGQEVERGFVLAEIDSTIYQAQLDQAIAKKAQDEAQLANARTDLARYVRLAESNSGTRQQTDTQKALVAQLEAQVQADQGAIDNARAILGYTKIIAPIAGRTGIRQVDVGNIVKASDATGLVMIAQIKPISVIFTLPQQQLARVNQAFGQGPLSADAMGADNRAIIDRGALQVVDNQVDQTTGTVKLKADFPNADLQLWPGQFVNVRLLVETLKQAIVIPTSAIQRGPTGPFVYVVEEGDLAAVRPVTVAQQDETQAVVASGLRASERVVTTGFTRLTDGSQVAVGSAAGTSPPAAVERPRGRRGEGGQRRNPPQ